MAKSSGGCRGRSGFAIGETPGSRRTFAKRYRSRSGRGAHSFPFSATAFGLLIAVALGSAEAMAQEEDAAPDTVTNLFTLSGQIVDGVNDRPVVAAVIKVPDLVRYAFSNADGRFSFADFPEGTWDIVVEQLGYHTTAGPVTVSEGNGLFIRLSPDPIAMEGFQVRSRSQRLLSDRRRGTPYRVLPFGPNEIARAINPDPTMVLKHRSGAPIVLCPGDRSLVSACIIRKGRPSSIGVYLDETPLAGGMEVLSTYPIENIHSMDLILFPGTGMLRVYTHWFVERLDDSKAHLAPILW